MIDLAYASALAPGAGAGAALTQILFLASIFAIFYFLLIRPQQKQKREREQMLRGIKKGDRVVTTGGLLGTIVGLNEDTVVLKIADQVKVECLRSAVAGVRGPGGDGKESS